MIYGNYKDISSQSVQDKRATKYVPINPPNGSLQDYVPFYFGPRSPTLYAIKQNPQDHGGVHQSELIYLATRAETIAQSGLSFVFTDGHAVVDFTEYFDNLADLNQVDWGVVRGRYWHDHPDYDPDRKRKRQAEFLVHQACPWEQIEEVGVFNHSMQQSIINLLKNFTQKPTVNVRRNWYY